MRVFVVYDDRSTGPPYYSLYPEASPPFPGKYPYIVILFKVVFQHLPPLRAYIPPVVRRVHHLLYMAGAAAPVCQPQIIGISVAACDPRHSSGSFKQCPARHNAAAQHIEAILCHPVHAWLEQRIAPLPLLQPVFVAKYQIIALGIFCEGIQRVRAENIARPHIHDKVELVRLRAFGDYPPAVGLFLYGVLGEPSQFIPVLSRYGYGYHGHSGKILPSLCRKLLLRRGILNDILIVSFVDATDAPGLLTQERLCKVEYAVFVVIAPAHMRSLPNYLSPNSFATSRFLYAYCQGSS